jgi:hypothetical protein
MSEHRVIPAARRQPELLNPQRVLVSLRALFRPDGTLPADDAIAATRGTGIEPPVPFEQTGEPIAVERNFAFVDITGFTEFCDKHGDHAAIDVLTRFRTLCRHISARRGVRVAKWLGDGAMLVGVEEGPVIASVAELVARTPAEGIDTHGGIASGTVLLFEGDDYVGRPPNLASRLCDAAEPGEILTHSLSSELPPWIETRDSVTVEVAGVGELMAQSVGVRRHVADSLVGDGLGGDPLVSDGLVADDPVADGTAA